MSIDPTKTAVLAAANQEDDSTINIYSAVRSALLTTTTQILPTVGSVQSASWVDAAMANVGWAGWLPRDSASAVGDSALVGVVGVP